MNYTFFAVACYIVMRATQVLFEEHTQRKWCKVLIKVITLGTLYAAIASLIVWYKELNLLGFDPSE